MRLSQEQEHFLLNPYGLLYNEITAGSLVKVDMQGNIIDRGNTALGINKAGFILHAAIHAARPDVKCIIHTHVTSTVAVSIKEVLCNPLSNMCVNQKYPCFFSVKFGLKQLSDTDDDKYPLETLLQSCK